MPAIRQFSAPALGLEPTEIGIRATTDAARRAGASFNEVAQESEAVGNRFARNLGNAIQDAGSQVVAYAEHREIAQGAAAWAGLNDKLTQQWNDIAKNADPNDPTVAAKFREGVMEKELENYRSGFLTEGGQKFAESHVESLRNHMFQKTAADMSSLAAKAVEVNVRTTANGLSNTAMTDPSSVPHLLGSVDGMVGDMVNSAPNLKGADSAKARLELTERMKEQIVKSGAIGAIQNSSDPEKTAAAWGAKYPEYINGADLRMLSANARQQIRARNYDERMARTFAKQEATDRSTEATNQYLIDTRSRDPRIMGDPLAVKILNDPNLLKADKSNLLNYIDRQLKPETDTRISSQTTVDLLRDVHGQDADADALMERAWQARLKDPGTPGSINERDFNTVRNEILGRKNPEAMALNGAKENFLKAVAPLIDKSNPLMGKIDQDGKMQEYRFRMDLDRKIAEYQKAGKNPYDLFDPSKPDFIGKPDALQPYQKTISQSLQDQAQRLRSQARGAAPPQRQPGESPEAYLKRTGRQ